MHVAHRRLSGGQCTLLWHTLAHAHKQEYDCMSMYVRYVAFAADAARRGDGQRGGERRGDKQGQQLVHSKPALVQDANPLAAHFGFAKLLFLLCKAL